MQKLDEFIWAKEKYGWMSEETNPAQKKSCNEIPGAKILNEQIASKVPHVIALQKVQEIAEAGINTIKENIERSKAMDEEAKQTGRKESSSTSMIFVGSMLMLLFVMGSLISSFLIVGTFISAPAVATPAVLTQLEKESQIVDIAKKELLISSENIGGEKYKNWYGINGNWCAMFVSYCSNECGYIEKDIMPKSASVLSMSNWYKERGLWKDASEYIPKVGDIIFFQNGMSHVGIVIDYDDSRKIIKTIEGNTGSVDTIIEHPHLWDVTVCQLCGGDHLIAEQKTCATCKGKGYILKKSGTPNVYKDNSTIMKYTGCGSCGGSGTETAYYNKYGCAWSEGSMVYGTGKTGSAFVCMGCFNLPQLFGKAVRCTNENCIYTSYGAWDDYPGGICFTTTIEYHEGSAVQEKSYPITYEKISGYGLPEYPYQIKDSDNN